MFGRFLFLRKDADVQNFFRKCFWKNLGRSSKEDFEKGRAFFKISSETSMEEFKKICRKALTLSYAKKAA